jgi:hypothetical protein
MSWMARRKVIHQGLFGESGNLGETAAQQVVPLQQKPAAGGDVQVVKDQGVEGRIIQGGNSCLTPIAKYALRGLQTPLVQHCLATSSRKGATHYKREDITVRRFLSRGEDWYRGTEILGRDGRPPWAATWGA